MDLADDPQADTLDALLCAVQAAWAWTHRERGFGMPEDCDRLEGWIADPASHGRSASTLPARSKLIDSRPVPTDCPMKTRYGAYTCLSLPIALAATKSLSCLRRPEKSSFRV
jgi:hypothetical protein